LSNNMAPRLKESELKRLTHIKVYLRHKRKRGMKLKKDLSFTLKGLSLS
jgi:hypothetical protein